MKAVVFTCCFGADDYSDDENDIIIIVNDCEYYDYGKVKEDYDEYRWMRYTHILDETET